MPTTNFPNGITSFGTLVTGGAGLLPVPGGNTFWVSSFVGSAGGDGLTPATALSTLTAGLAKCVANNGDVIYLDASHAETITAAAGINVNKAGVTIIGCGNGANRPTFTFTTSTAATITITAANVTMRNFVTKIGLDQVVSPIVISGANCFLDMYEHQDGAANMEALEAILTTAGASNLKVNMKYVGFTAGTHCTAAIKMVGVAGALINMDFYGKASTAVVNFITTLCSNVEVYGYMYNAAATDGSKNVVDTITGSLWYTYHYDGSAGYQVTGGSAQSLASDGPSTAAGTYFILKKTITSSAITTSPQSLTSTASGDFYVENVVLMTDSTGLAGGTNFQILQNGPKGLATVIVETVANLGANKTVDTYTASVTKQRSVLQSGQLFQYDNTVAAGTGAGTVDVYFILVRRTAGATIS